MRMAALAVALAVLAACAIEQPPPGPPVLPPEGPVAERTYGDYIGAGEDIDPVDDVHRLD